MDHDYPADPYPPPGSEKNAGVASPRLPAELADRGTRLWATSLDGLIHDHIAGTRGVRHLR